MTTFIFFAIAYFVILFSIIKLSHYFKFYDYPKDRSAHHVQTINTGGIAILIFMTIISATFELSYEIENIFLTGILIGMTGFLDDRFETTPGVKMLLISIPIIYLILNGFLLTNIGIYEFFGILNLGKISFFFTFLCVGLLLNGINYIDGIDGLLLSIVSIGVVYLIILETDTKIINLLYFFLIPLIINLFFNFLPYGNYFKVFSGDTGSLYLGFVASFLLIFMFIFRGIHPAYLVWAFWYPIYDFLYVNFIRLKKGRSVFKPDNLHLHHYILKKFGGSHIKSTITISFFNIILISLGYTLSEFIGKIYSLSAFILSFIVFLIINAKFLNRGVEQSGSSSGS